MHDATSPRPQLRLAIAPGVASSYLAALLALQRAEEPEVSMEFNEVTASDLITGLYKRRFDVGLSLKQVSDSSLKSLSIWFEATALATPLRYPLLRQQSIRIDELKEHSVFRWKAEYSPSLDQYLSSMSSTERPNVQHVGSFEMLLLWVAAGYGVGISSRSRIETASQCGICTRPIADGPYEVITHLQRLSGQTNLVADRFELRALRVAEARKA
ncbi:LysR substrate-binding domain-containing protein [Stenotrophomonas sp. GD04024]|uniref:LysR substrate-binding domain-containing protein n=1 Tax=Stenotrophomonas sp. GD04024 TaxID=2975422 RepID=UPI00244CD892|nr:LysR substrate-binding domain-containing protein [Stenotrophomonas sp. GD04024]MDG9986313.1 LysR substrate-binding domain-containing protein [Stenotrophomonas sp. GD04024]